MGGFLTESKPAPPQLQVNPAPLNPAPQPDKKGKT